MAVRVNFACNDPDNGDCLGRFNHMDVDAGDLHMEFEGYYDEEDGCPVEFSFATRSGMGRVKVGSLEVQAFAFRGWYGNWCWDGVSVSWVDALALINQLGPDWRMTEGPCLLFDAFEARHEISPQEWRAENDAVLLME
jgi:hypothetical protein